MSFELKIRDLLADNYSGSAAILDKIIKSIKTYTNSREVDLVYLRENIEKVAFNFPDLAVLTHFTLQFFDYLEHLEQIKLAPAKFKSRIDSFLQEYTKEWEEKIDQAAEKMARLVSFSGKKILLHSNSSSIYVLFKHLAFRNIFPSVYQTMSGPVFEGKIQARLLAELGCKVHFINENAIGRFIDEIDFALVGADNVFTDGFTNKVGTYPIALVCKEKGKPLYVLCDSRKRSPVDYNSRVNAMFEKEAPAEDLWKKAPSAITAVNYYFEFTPQNLANAYFFEDTWYSFELSDPNRKE